MKRPKTFIFGAGGGGLAAYELLSKRYEILGFLDNNSKLQGHRLRGVPIFSPLSFPMGREDSIHVASMYVSEILSQLIELGYPLEKIEFVDLSPSASPALYLAAPTDSSERLIIRVFSVLALLVIAALVGFCIGRWTGPG